ncbi:RIP metalloprotease RseP [Phaeovulum vinaykumarii]|uniref:Zinc metalloprotease n=1 Tax=Phaeovulum vinaykumarii TaxID=407234 RepID=A0A1N7MUH8_9RHOB|nr:RIP metalloprotease RseP [Phaeovulum vinaykumarii]SIS89804.1 regulator of sigma E protease [Phaeovulum vinaykumarii]SOC17047.1 regulator of sigma E protease [Phaeovulum vinaykumarii]
MDLASLLPDFGDLGLTIAAFVVALSIIVTVHEFGHYIVGRWSGIRAEVFSIGFGPRLFSRVDRHGTRWQVAAFPFGGYVKFLGDANAASASADAASMDGMDAQTRRQSLHGAPLWARAATVAAGPVANFILAIVVFAGVYIASGTAVTQPTVGGLHALPQGAGGVQAGDVIVGAEGRAVASYADLDALLSPPAGTRTMTYEVERDGARLVVTGPPVSPPRLGGVAPGSAAVEAELAKGDVLLAANGIELSTFSDLQRVVNAAAGTPVALEVWRPGEDGTGTVFERTLTPRSTDLPLRSGGFETRWIIGATGGYFFDPATRPTGVIEALGKATGELSFVITSSLSGLWHMITGAISTCNLRGPLGIAETSGSAAATGAQNFVWFIGVLSAAVGLLNLFPIPVLDGGHLIFHAWEAITGRAPSNRVLGFLTTAGLALILTMTAFGLTNDLFCP